MNINGNHWKAFEVVAVHALSRKTVTTAVCLCVYTFGGACVRKLAVTTPTLATSFGAGKFCAP
ncbi:hypothetical protein GQ600_1442 [Phytophthora cactorum]|nr:hypothetical protein GQ600_1442 [Phytophthora cactorum]